MSIVNKNVIFYIMSNNTTSSCNEAGFECYNVIDSSQLVTSIWLSAAGGAAVVLLFTILRNVSSWKAIYHKRATQISDLRYRPGPFRTKTLVDRAFSFLYPVFGTRDVDIFRSSGLDSLMMVRINTLGAQLFLPLAVFGSAVLIPLYKTSGYLTETTTNVDVIMTYSMSNVASKDPVLWVPLAMFLGFTLYALWAIFVHLKSYAAFRMLQEHRVEVSQTLGLHPMTLLADLSKDEDYRNVIGDTHGFLLWIKAAAGFFSPWHMHSQDLAFIRLCRTSYERMLEAKKEKEACEDAMVHAEYDLDVQEPVHPWWQSPEDTPVCVNSVYKPRGVLLGKSNWAYRKSCHGVLPQRKNAPCCTSAHNYVVEYRNAGDVESKKGRDVHAEVSKVISIMYSENKSIRQMPEREDHAAVGDRLNLLEGDLKMLFPRSFMKLVPVYYYRSTDEAIQVWDETVAKIHAQQSRLDAILKKHKVCEEEDVETGGGMFSQSMYTRRAQKIRKLNDTLASLIEKKNELEAKITELRQVRFYIKCNK